MVELRERENYAGDFIGHPLFIGQSKITRPHLTARQTSQCQEERKMGLINNLSVSAIIADHQVIVTQMKHSLSFLATISHIDIGYGTAKFPRK